jgi:putative nucleotidyltransferase with HDIG domain
MDVSPRDEDFANAVQQRIASLPLLPSVVSQLLALDSEQDDYLDEVNRLAAWDPTLAIRLVEYASRSIRVPGAAEKFRVRHAVARLGTRQIANLVTTLALVDAFPAQTQSDRDLWIHSVQVGVFSRWLSVLMPDLRFDPEHAYLTGLLHDIGRFVVFQSVPECPARVDEFGWTDSLTLIAAENSVLGTDHVSIGREACARWGLPSAITDIVALHHDFDLPLDTFEDRQLATRVGIVQIADALSMRLMQEQKNMTAGAGEAMADDDAEPVVDALRNEIEKALERASAQLPETHKVALPGQIPKLLHNIDEETRHVLHGLGIAAGDD